MSTADNWPDASKPGVPLSPEQDGWHWLGDADDPTPHEWRADTQEWYDPYSCMWLRAQAAVRWGGYVARCLTHSEADALLREWCDVQTGVKLAAVTAERDAALAEATRLREALVGTRSLLTALTGPDDALAQAMISQCDAALAPGVLP